MCAKSRYPLIDLTLHEGGEYGISKAKAVAGGMVDWNCDVSEAERFMMGWDDDEDQDEGAF